MARQRLPLLSLFAAISVLVAVVHSALNINWSSPSAGDVYEPGQSIVGEWYATDIISSPVFRLCILDEGDTSAEDDGDSDGVDEGDSCGSTVRPLVQRTDQSYQVTLAVPNVTAMSGFYLEMVDGSGNTVASPQFSLTPGKPSSENFTAGTNVASRPNIPPTLPSLAQTRMPSSTAAYAVPLALVGAVALTALAVCVYHRRKLANEQRAMDQRKDHGSSSIPAAREWNWRHSWATASLGATIPTPGKAVNTPSKEGDDIYTSVYLPTLPHRQPRQSTREPFKSRPSTVPARLFKEAASPILKGMEVSSCEQTDTTTEVDAVVNDAVVSRYLRPSPIPPFPPTPKILTAPKQLHVRKGTNVEEQNADVYDEVARKLSTRR